MVVLYPVLEEIVFRGLLQRVRRPAARYAGRGRVRTMRRRLLRFRGGT
ncbi:MAG: hypothetical protein LC667_09430 [Thioalkalivibrio sp.]|nr:hypothetical protein [Thioalkalivibrio sp.]